MKLIKNLNRIITAGIFLTLSAAAVTAEKPRYRDPKAPVSERVADLLGRMTIDEKIGQLLCPMGWEFYERDGNGAKASASWIELQKTASPPGSLWAVLRADPWTQKTPDNGLNAPLSAEALNDIQRHAIEDTRLGIPVLIAEECVHGLMGIGSTVYPTGLLLASTWDPELVRRIGHDAGMEAYTRGARVGYGPVLDVARDPRWSRCEETYGEDPVLSGEVGSAYALGLQDAGMVSTLKHLAAYGIPESGINGAPAQTGPVKLHSDYLEPFRRAVSKGAGSVMTSYNMIDGTPCTADSVLIGDVLRGDWDFDGIVFSDLFSIDGIAGAGVAGDMTDAAALALRAGVYIDLGANAYARGLKEALRQGLVTEAHLDSAVSRVLGLKFRLGLFENPYSDSKTAIKNNRTPEHLQDAREAVRRGTVLLKNNGLLPLDRAKVKRIAVIGPNAENVYNQLGDYTGPQLDGETVTLLQGIRNVAGKGVEIEYVRGCAIRDTATNELAEAEEAARRADVVILAIGGSSARDFRTHYDRTGAASGTEGIPDIECGEGMDRATLALTGLQDELLRRVLATGTPTAVVYIAGRPLDMRRAARDADALLEAWYCGAQGGNGIADILFGDCNPSGRLPMTIPQSEAQLPMYYSQKQRRDYVDMPGMPLYPFGYGLSYTTFEYEDMRLMEPAEAGVPQRVAVKVRNSGERDGAEVVQLYVSDPVASIGQPPVALRDFRRVQLKAGESADVIFPITDEHLSIVNRRLQRVVEPGEFILYAGPNSATLPLSVKISR